MIPRHSTQYLSATDPSLRFGDRRLVCSTCFRTRIPHGEETKKENFPIEIRCRGRVPCRRHLLRPTLGLPKSACVAMFIFVLPKSRRRHDMVHVAPAETRPTTKKKNQEEKLSVSLPASGSRTRPREVLSASVTLHSLVPDLRLTYLILRSVLPVYQSQTRQTLIRLLSH